MTISNAIILLFIILFSSCGDLESDAKKLANLPCEMRNQNNPNPHTIFEMQSEMEKEFKSKYKEQYQEFQKEYKKAFNKPKIGNKPKSQYNSGVG